MDVFDDVTRKTLAPADFHAPFGIVGPIRVYRSSTIADGLVNRQGRRGVYLEHRLLARPGSQGPGIPSSTHPLLASARILGERPWIENSHRGMMLVVHLSAAGDIDLGVSNP